MKKTLLIAALALASATAHADLNSLSAQARCPIVGQVATGVATLRSQGVTEKQQNEAISEMVTTDQNDEETRLMQIRLVYAVYHDDRYRHGVSPKMIGEMVTADCLARGE